MSMGIGVGKHPTHGNFRNLQLDGDLYRFRNGKGEKTPYVVGIGMEAVEIGKTKTGNLYVEANAGAMDSVKLSDAYGGVGMRYSAKAIAQYEVYNGEMRIGARAMAAPATFKDGKEDWVLPGPSVEVTRSLRDGSVCPAVGVALPF